MSLIHKKKADDVPQDPLAGATPSPEDEKKKDRIRRTVGRKQILRAEKLEKLIEKGEDIDPEAVISMYRPQRKGRMFGAELLRMDRLRLLALALIILLLLLFILAFSQEKMGNFTININRLELFRKGISIDTDESFPNPTSRLVAKSVYKATNIADSDIPGDVDSIDGDHSGENYFAYTYYVRNGGKVDVDYKATVTLDSCAKGAEKAIRVAIWRNGEKTVYAEPAADGSAEPGTIPFLSDTVICMDLKEDFCVGDKDKFTIVIWLDGDDPECVDSIVGGGVQLSMYIDTVGEDDRALWVKYMQDVVDSVTGNNAIGAAGNEAPEWQYGKAAEETEEFDTVSDIIDDLNKELMSPTPMPSATPQATK